MATKFEATNAAGVANSPPSASATTMSAKGAATPSRYDEATPSARNSNRANGTWPDGIEAAVDEISAAATAVQERVTDERSMERTSSMLGTNALARRPRQMIGHSFPGDVRSAPIGHLPVELGTVNSIPFRNSVLQSQRCDQSTLSEVNVSFGSSVSSLCSR
jgi:hypothetical protein